MQPLLHITLPIMQPSLNIEIAKLTIKLYLEICKNLPKGNHFAFHLPDCGECFDKIINMKLKITYFHMANSIPDLSKPKVIIEFLIVSLFYVLS